jgi:hypothetical protein
MSYFDLENNYQSVFGDFLNPLLFFNRDQNGLINDTFNNNMMFLMITLIFIKTRMLICLLLLIMII